MGVPGITAPTMSVEELDKKINDLKAVEAWLNLI
jgi:ribosomal protein L29